MYDAHCGDALIESFRYVVISYSVVHDVYFYIPSASRYRLYISERFVRKTIVLLIFSVQTRLKSHLLHHTGCINLDLLHHTGCINLHLLYHTGILLQMLYMLIGYITCYLFLDIPR